MASWPSAFVGNRAAPTKPRRALSRRRPDRHRHGLRRAITTCWRRRSGPPVRARVRALPLGRDPPENRRLPPGVWVLPSRCRSGRIPHPPDQLGDALRSCCALHAADGSSIRRTPAAHPPWIWFLRTRRPFVAAGCMACFARRQRRARRAPDQTGGSTHDDDITRPRCCNATTTARPRRHRAHPPPALPVFSASGPSPHSNILRRERDIASYCRHALPFRPVRRSLQQCVLSFIASPLTPSRHPDDRPI